MTPKLGIAILLIAISLTEGINGGSLAVPNRARRAAAAKSCTTAHQLLKGTSYKIKSSDAKGGKACEWAIAGSSDCTPQLDCRGLALKRDEDCPNEYLQIADGIGGLMKVCGKINFDKPVIASGNGRDIFVKYQDGDYDSRGFECEVSCVTNKKAVIPLPLDFERKEDSRCVCGLQNQDNRIVGGEDATMNEFPWQAALVYTGTRQPKCGASVLNDRMILTATHCFYFDEMKPEEFEVLTHAHILDLTKKDNAKDVPLGREGSIRGSGYNLKAYTDADEKTQRHRVAEIYQHPLFTEQYDYDYAIVRLDKRIDLAAPDAPTPICLPPTLMYDKTFEGSTPMVVGWGMPDENAGSTTRVLQKLPVPIIPLPKCSSWFPGLVTPRMICAGYEEGKRDACTGDSGGPLVLKQANKQWWQIGIVSWGEGCAGKHKPGFYSRVTEQLQWILYHANKNDAKWCKDKK